MDKLNLVKPVQDAFTMALKAQTGIIAVKEYKFHDKRNWRFDYAIPDKKIFIECDGARFKKRQYRDKRTGQLITTIGGRHNSGKGFEDDCEKKNAATVLGWRGIVVFPETLFNLSTFEMIVQACL